MATEIDALQLNIMANTSRAETSIENLAQSLRKLGDSIGVFNDMANVAGSIDKFSSAMTDLGDATKNVDIKQIKSVSSAVNSLYNAVKRITEFKATTGVGKDIKAIGQEIAKEFGITAPEAVDTLVRSIRQYYSTLENGGDQNEAVKNIENIIKEYASLDNVMSDTIRIYNALRTALSSGKIQIPKNFWSEYGDAAKSLRGIIGIKNTSNSKSAMEIGSRVQDINDILNTNFDADDNLPAINAVVEALQKGKTEAEDMRKNYWASAEGIELMNRALDSVVDKTLAVANAQRKNPDANKGNNISNYLYDLEGINVPDFSGVKVLADSMTKLSGVNATAAGESLKQIAQGLKAFESVSIPNIGDAANFASQLRMLGSKTIRGAGDALPKIVASLREFNGITVAQDKIAGLAELAKTIGIFGRQTSREALYIIPNFAASFKKLMQELSTAPAISRNVIDLSNALGNFLANVRNVSGSTRQASNGFKLFGNSVKTSSKKLFDFGRIIGKFYAKWFLILRAFSKIKQAVGISSDLKEVQNVVDTTFGSMTNKVEEFASNAVENFGISELSAKKFASRFQAMGVAMAIPAKQIEEAQKKLNSINPELASRGYSDTANSIADMSINVTKLAADMASFYNVAQEDVAKDLEAIYTGMTRPLRQYGLDLTETTLAEWAMKNGLDANIKSMTQAEKTILRYQYVLANTSAAQGKSLVA